jgi:hypothetical protein
MRLDRRIPGRLDQSLGLAREILEVLERQSPKRLTRYAIAIIGHSASRELL